ncbi:MAG: aminodeoxychorismate synthase component I [Streptosporangiales bacterium]|nr:aminodeoxychorismate synthase component I [Streptosporangiales bacterium]
MNTLLVDNHDSYTYNLYQLIADVTGTPPVVLVNDDERLARLDPRAFDACVISPGPGRPHRESDTGHLAGFLNRAGLPVLGVCLGHQIIAHAAGAAVGSAPEPRHGHVTTVQQCISGEHGGDPLLRGLPPEFSAVRYHSLAVREPLPPSLEVTARAEDGVIMALRHRTLPRWGVQFHPESVATEFGRELIANFATLAGHPPAPKTRESVRLVPPQPSASPSPPTTSVPKPPPAGAVPPQRPRAGNWRLTGRALRLRANPEVLFSVLFGSSASGFWLDSSMAQPGLSRFSFMGDTAGPLSETLTYRAGDGNVIVTDSQGIRTEPGSMFDVLERRLAQRRLTGLESEGLSGGLPFGFTGGYVGYFGYEMKADCGAPSPHQAGTPDAVWIFADRLVAIDHETGVTYLIAVHDDTDPMRADAREWVEATARRVTALAEPGGTLLGGGALGTTRSGDPVIPGGAALSGPDLAGYLVRDPDSYRADIAECQRQLRLGESYEICLTNRLHLPFHGSDLAYYRRLRRVNPAPYSAFIRAGGVSVFSSSPERFLRVESGSRGQRRVESKPIKGTAPRHPDPQQDKQVAAMLATDPKTRAENLMIVDLLRNDLGRVCEIGSVAVTRYMDVESYTTMHQLVSTVSGRLRPSVGAVECVRACFPGGSMTGAPKQRTMEIIDRLETEARGVYSGTLGYFGLGGEADLSIVIRTAVRQGNTLTVGAGGAIVLGSDPGDEYEEMLLKASAPLRAYGAASPVVHQ